MRIVGKIPTSQVEEPVITALQGVEKKCAVCKKRWDDGEKVVIFITSVITNDTIPLQDDSMHIVHLSPCLEEFVGTIMASFPKPEEVKKEQVTPAPQQ